MSTELAVLGFARSYYFGEGSPLVDPEDWHEVLGVSRRHRTICALAKAMCADIPKEVLLAAKRESVQHVQSQLLQRAELDRIARRLSLAEKRFLVWKGLALQDRYYGECIRPHADIDLACDSHDFAEILAILDEEGFKPVERELPGQADCSPTGCTVSNALGTEIDLHLRIVDRRIGCSPSFDALYARRLKGNNGLWSMPGHVDHLYAVLMHGFKHQWCRVQFLIDVAILLRHSTPEDLEELREYVKEVRAVQAVSTGIFLADDCLLAPNGPKVALFPRTPRVDCLVRAYKSRLFRPLPNTFPTKLNNFYLHLAGLDGMKERLNYITERAPFF